MRLQKASWPTQDSFCNLSYSLVTDDNNNNNDDDDMVEYNDDNDDDGGVLGPGVESLAE